jgi:hypothetical protein
MPVISAFFSLLVCCCCTRRTLLLVVEAVRPEQFIDERGGVHYRPGGALATRPGVRIAPRPVPRAGVVSAAPARHNVCQVHDMKRTVAVVIGGGLAAAATIVAAQDVPPFFGTGAVAFEPEVGFVHTGIMQEAQGQVSPDRKYVTLGMPTSAKRTLAFDEFNFQRSTGLGVVGQVDRPGHAPSVLDREGITRIDP